MAKANWLIYGAYGYTGKLIAKEAVAQGERPLLAGRSAEKLKPLAAELGLEWIAVDLNDQVGLEKALGQVELVLNAAGPFNSTARPLAEACLKTGVNYLDVANELPVYRSLLELDKAARTKGIALISGVGYGTVATNFLAKKVVEKLPDATQVEVAIAPYTYTTEQTTGAAKSVLEAIAEGAKTYKQGKLVSSRSGKGIINVVLPDGQKLAFLPSATGDLAAAYLATGVPNVIAYAAVKPNPVLPLVLPVVQGLFSLKPVLKAVSNYLDKQAARPKAAPKPKEDKLSYSWARATNAENKQVELWLETGEGYDFTVRSAVKAVQETLQLKPQGTLAPAQAFRPEFVLEIPETRLIEGRPGF